mgnify:CR=1 FL=1
MFNNFITRLREYIFIILTATIFLLFTTSKSFTEENIFVVDNVEVQGPLDLNFSRDKYINRAISKTFKTWSSISLCWAVTSTNVSKNSLSFF